MGFDFLLQQTSFAEAFFAVEQNHVDWNSLKFADSLFNLFGCSFEGMVLGASRVWDERRLDLSLISIPNLVANFADQSYLGCHGLRSGREDRAQFDALYYNPIRSRLRVARTELLAHCVILGRSRDRYASDIIGLREFKLVNADVLSFCRETLDLLYSLNRQLHIGSWREDSSLEKMKREAAGSHIALLNVLLQSTPT